MRPIVVVGAGGFGRETLDVIEAINAQGARWDVLGVVDDAPSRASLERLADRGIAHLGGIDVAASLPHGTHYVIGVGAPAARASIYERMQDACLVAATLIHPAATIGSRAIVGSGSVICGGVQVSTNVLIGRHVHLNPNATIGHDAKVGDFASVNPGGIVSGEVHLGQRTLIGAGAVVLQGLTIGSDVVIGAASCVTRDVAAESTVRGVPAR